MERSNQMDSLVNYSHLRKNSQELQLNKLLIKAIEINNLDQLKSLIERGATLSKLRDIDLHIYSSEHETPLHLAVKLGRTEIVKYLISIGCDVNAQTRTKFAAPIHYATYKYVPPEILEILIKEGAKIDLLDSDKSSALLWASFLNRSDAVEILIKNKADTTIIDIFNLSALDWAAREGSFDALKTLIKLVKYKTSSLKVALSEAVESGQEEVASYLDTLLTSSKA